MYQGLSTGVVLAQKASYAAGPNKAAALRIGWSVNKLQYNVGSRGEQQGYCCLSLVLPPDTAVSQDAIQQGLLLGLFDYGAVHAAGPKMAANMDTCW